MTREQEAAHLRMICSLPVRKVDAKEHAEAVTLKRARREVEIRGKVYESITEASRRLKISTKTVYTMAKYGTARFLSSGMRYGSENFTRLA